MSSLNLDDVDFHVSAHGTRTNSSAPLTVQLLGAGQEVGRSCAVITYKSRMIVCDVGVHPAFTGMSALPFLDEIEWSDVDAILVSHFHLDHAAGLTYVMEKTNFKEGKGQVYMSHPTKGVYRLLMSDYVRVSTVGLDHGRDSLFSEEEMLKSWNTIIGFDFEQEITLSTPGESCKFSSFAAGHVLGACMFLIEIAGIRVLYTGDYSTEEDRHLVPAKVPVWDRPPEVMICESTYGIQAHEPRLEKEARFTSTVHAILKRGGRVLLPVFALGRAQELLLILDEYWAQHPDLQRVPIYFVSSLAVRCMDVYRQYIHTLAPAIRDKFAAGTNPLDFRGNNSFIRPLDRGRARLDDSKPCVVMASPGFLTTGVSRELLEKWAPDARNGVIITGYSVEGVMARTILNEPSEIPAQHGGFKIPRRLSVHSMSFSAHVDYPQNAHFIEQVLPSHLILVHGEATNMNRLRGALKSRFAEKQQDVKIYTPRNVDVVKLRFQGDRTAKVVGRMALDVEKIDQSTRDVEGRVPEGALVTRDAAQVGAEAGDVVEPGEVSEAAVEAGEIAEAAEDGSEVAPLALANPTDNSGVDVKMENSQSISEAGAVQEPAPTGVGAPPQTLTATIISKDMSYTLLDAADLKEFTGLNTSVILEQQRMSVGVTWDLVKWHLRSMYGRFDEGVDSEGAPAVRIMQTVDVKSTGPNEITVEWAGSSINDMVADSVVALVLGIDSSSATIKKTSSGHAHTHEHDLSEVTIDPEEPEKSLQLMLKNRLDNLIVFLGSYFGSVELLRPSDVIEEAAKAFKTEGVETEEAIADKVSTEVKTEDGEVNTGGGVKLEEGEVEPQEIDVKMEDMETQAETENIGDHDTAPTIAQVERLDRHKQTSLPIIRVTLDTDVADIYVEDMAIYSTSEALKGRVRHIIQLAVTLITPLDEQGPLPVFPEDEHRVKVKKIAST